MRRLQLVNIITVIATVTINILSQALPFNNQSSAEIANRFTNNFFLPANYVFGIWGIIYLSMAAFAIYQSRRDSAVVRSFGWWWAIAGIGNSAWLFSFHWNQFALSMVFMVLLLVSLLAMYLKLRAPGVTLTRGERWFVSAPISLYFAWVTVATIANACYVLIDGGWDGFGIAYETWGAIMVVIGGLIAGGVAYANRDVIYAAVIVWSFTGIVSRHPDVTQVAVSAGAFALLVGAIGLFAIVSRAFNSGSTPLRPGTT
jgi:hypothetical protein